jgi:hypothetical protein
LAAATLRDRRSDASRSLPAVSGSNLTAAKARLPLMACLMKYGSPPAAADPANPTPADVDAMKARLAMYSQVFNTH